MEKIIFFGLAIPILAFVIYLGGSAIMKGFSAKVSNRPHNQEQSQDFSNENGSENHFGLFTVDGKAKYSLWKNVDNGDFNGLTRNGNSITKTYNGNSENLLNNILTPPSNN